MDSKPEITIVIPLYNRANLVVQTLESVRRQTFRPLHLIVVDNNSTDRSAEVVAEWIGKYCRQDFTAELLSEPIPGAPAARNRGLRAVTTEYTMFFDSDDLMYPGHVARAMEAFHTCGKPDLVGWDMPMVLVDGRRRVERFMSRDVLWNCIMHGSMSTQRYAARTEFFRRAGEWNPQIRGWQDVELGMRLLLLNPKIYKCGGEATAEVRRQEVSISGTDYISGADRWEASIDAMEQTLARVGKQRYANVRRAILAGQYLREGGVAGGEALLAKALARERNPFRRVLLRFAAHYTARGHRGVAHIIRPFF